MCVRGFRRNECLHFPRLRRIEINRWSMWNRRKGITECHNSFGCICAENWSARLRSRPSAILLLRRAELQVCYIFHWFLIRDRTHRRRHISKLLTYNASISFCLLNPLSGIVTQSGQQVLVSCDCQSCMSQVRLSDREGECSEPVVESWWDEKGRRAWPGTPAHRRARLGSEGGDNLVDESGDQTCDHVQSLIKIFD